MKTLAFKSIAAATLIGLVGLAGCSRGQVAQSSETDDLYFTSKDKKVAAYAPMTEASTAQNQPQKNLNPDYLSQYSQQTQQSTPPVATTTDPVAQGDTYYDPTYNTNGAVNTTLAQPRTSSYGYNSIYPGYTTNNYYGNNYYGNAGYDPYWGNNWNNGWNDWNSWNSWNSGWNNGWGWNRWNSWNSGWGGSWNSGWCSPGVVVSVGWGGGWGWNRWNNGWNNWGWNSGWYDPYWGGGWYGPGYGSYWGGGWGNTVWVNNYNYYGSGSGRSSNVVWGSTNGGGSSTSNGDNNTVYKNYGSRTGSRSTETVNGTFDNTNRTGGRRSSFDNPQQTQTANGQTTDPGNSNGSAVRVNRGGTPNTNPGVAPTDPVSSGRTTQDVQISGRPERVATGIPQPRPRGTEFSQRSSENTYSGNNGSGSYDYRTRQNSSVPAQTPTETYTRPERQSSYSESSPYTRPAQPQQQQPSSSPNNLPSSRPQRQSSWGGSNDNSNSGGSWGGNRSSPAPSSGGGSWGGGSNSGGSSGGGSRSSSTPAPSSGSSGSSGGGNSNGSATRVPR